jgi:hypothetical protein
MAGVTAAQNGAPKEARAPKTTQAPPQVSRAGSGQGILFCVDEDNRGLPYACRRFFKMLMIRPGRKVKNVSLLFGQIPTVSQLVFPLIRLPLTTFLPAPHP